MADLKNIIAGPLEDAYRLLPAKLRSREATTMILATCGQESQFKYRIQMGGGPAHGLAQFELGKPGTGAGVYGVYEHPAVRDWLQSVCQNRDVPFTPEAIYAALVHDDMLALTMARLLYYTNAKPLPSLGDQDGAWSYYVGTWHPGKPRPQDWPANYQAALAAVRP